MSDTATQTLTAELHADGFVPGAPSCVSRYILHIDLAIAKRVICPRCRHRGTRGRPYHRGNDYCVIGRCPRCGSEVEL